MINLNFIFNQICGASNNMFIVTAVANETSRDRQQRVWHFNKECHKKRLKKYSTSNVGSLEKQLFESKRNEQQVRQIDSFFVDSFNGQLVVGRKEIDLADQG